MSDSELEEEVPNTLNTDNSEEPNIDDVLRILIATDIHLGYNEKDPVRSNDSFVTFEEILQHATNNNVDFILLGGDLFHDSKPSTSCYHRCISLLKKYCLGDKPIALHFLSDPSRNFSHLKNPIVNYEDPNLNIQIPVFSIHGNHDDPTGESNLSAMDILADTGLVNYFGKWTDLNKIEIYPLLIKKGQTQLALYGLSHIKDERLSRLFKEKKVTMTRPLDSDKWFNILVLHQNRAQNRGIKNFIPECVLPEFLDLVLWGHEHDCRIDPEDTVNGPRIIQPGSSVATSLAIGESLEKYIGMLRIHKNRFCLDKIKLQTVRPFLFRDMEIIKPPYGKEDKAKEYVKLKIEETIEEMIQKVSNMKTASSPMPPLIRLVVNFIDENLMSNSIRMGQNYRDKVANPIDMLSFKLKKQPAMRLKQKNGFDLKDLEEASSDQLTGNISDLVENYFEVKNQYLNVLSTKGLCEAVSRYIDRNDTDAIDDIVNHQSNKTLEKLLKNDDISEENFQEYLEQYRAERANKPNEELKDIEKVLESENRVGSRPVEDLTISSDDEDMKARNNSSTSSMSMTIGGGPSGRPARGRGSRGPRKSRGKGRAT